MIIDGDFQYISLEEQLDYAISEDNGELIFIPGSSLKKLIAIITHENLGHNIDLLLAKELLEYIIQKEYIESNFTYQQLISATSEQIFQHIQECLDSSKFKTHIKDTHIRYNSSEIVEKLHFMKVTHVEEICKYSIKDFQAKFKFTKYEAKTLFESINKWQDIQQIIQP